MHSRFTISVLFLTLALSLAPAADWPQWGGPNRNCVSLEKGVPLDFQLPTSENAGHGVAWQAQLGHFSTIPPVVADGLVWVGTMGSEPADEKLAAKGGWDGGLLLCFRESDGKLLWSHLSPRLWGEDVEGGQDSHHAPIGSAPLVEGDRFWYVNNRNEVVCFDIAPLKKGTGKPTEVWKLDMRKELAVHRYVKYHTHGFGASIAGYKDRLYVVTHNSVNVSHTAVPKPDAPSLVCLEKATGKVVWKDNSPGKNILQFQMSSPLVAEINGKPQVIVGQGDGWLRSFDANIGKLIWKCDLNAKDATWDIGDGTRNYIVASPILYESRIYITTSRDEEDSYGPGCLFCIDPTKEGDVSLELDAEPRKGKLNPNSAVVWHTTQAVPDDAPRIVVGTRKKRDLLRSREFYFGRSIGGCVASDGLVYAVETSGVLFCFDANTGKLYWVEDLKNIARGQMLWVDGKLLVTTASDIFAFAHGKGKKQLAKIEASQTFGSGPVFANGTLYLTEWGILSAVRKVK